MSDIVDYLNSREAVTHDLTGTGTKVVPVAPHSPLVRITHLPDLNAPIIYRDILITDAGRYRVTAISPHYINAEEARS